MSGGETVTATLKGLYALAEARGISIDFYPLTGTDGLTVCYKGRYAIALSPALKHNEREQAIVLAHEIAHALTGTTYRMDAPAEIVAEAERVADAKATELLETVGGTAWTP